VGLHLSLAPFAIALGLVELLPYFALMGFDPRLKVALLREGGGQRNRQHDRHHRR
jgi:hypothetical protein